MAPYLEIWRPSGPELVPIEGDRVTVGKDPANDVPLSFDPTVSHLHTVLERLPTGWIIRDLGSRNGTFVNGERIIGDRVVRPGDEIRLGKTRCSLRDQAHGPVTLTETAQAPPQLTRREREVLLALCRPVFSEDVFTESATTREIAAELFVTEAAVKQHLMHLYDKFGIHEEGERRRARLANEAIRRGAVTLADLKPSTGPG